MRKEAFHQLHKSSVESHPWTGHLFFNAGPVEALKFFQGKDNGRNNKKKNPANNLSLRTSEIFPRLRGRGTELWQNGVAKFDHGILYASRKDASFVNIGVRSNGKYWNKLDFQILDCVWPRVYPFTLIKDIRGMGKNSRPSGKPFDFIYKQQDITKEFIRFQQYNFSIEIFSKGEMSYTENKVRTIFFSDL